MRASIFFPYALSITIFFSVTNLESAIVTISAEFELLDLQNLNGIFHYSQL